MRLDVGCGGYPTGDVNVDFCIEDVGHRTGVKGVKGFSVPKNCNFVRWDLNNLPMPFEGGSFDEVYCSHVIEHVNDPFALLKDMIRISSFKVLIKCPHGFGERLCLRKNPFHKGYFKRSWFVEAVSVIGGDLEVLKKGKSF